MRKWRGFGQECLTFNHVSIILFYFLDVIFLFRGFIFFLIIIKCIFIVLLAMYAVSYVRRLPIRQFHW